jgi:periplasmic copper chaperone A
MPSIPSSLAAIVASLAMSVCLLTADARPTLSEVVAVAPWVRATVPAQKATGAFMTIRATAPMTLVEARSPVANIVEIHEMKHDEGVMKMRAIERLNVTAEAPGVLKPGGHHIMLIDLKAQVKEGDMVPLTLIFEDAAKQRRTLEVSAPARKRPPEAAK